AVLIVHIKINAQIDSLKSRLTFDADFRFRIEQDWDSRKSDGSYREDRTRLRYRLRAGATYKAKWYEVGFRIRTGNPIKQQDPQITLGDGNSEFGTLPIGIEKAYFQGKWNTFIFCVGKNTFPFEKNNELFWSDNVFPEGVTIQNKFNIKSNFINNLNIKAGHYIITTSNKSFDKDSYLQGFQISSSFFDSRISLFPSFYYFKNIPDIPDGNDNFLLNYSIFHIGTKFKILNDFPLYSEFDYYKNLQDYTFNDLIDNNLKNQKSGYVIGLKYGELLNKSDWVFSTTYAKIQKFSAVDFLAQNDWARWDYSSSGSPDGRLTNFNGIELAAGYKIDKKVILKLKYYYVNQIIPLGMFKENGSRIRLDLDVKF
ncbi:putative porin, partial [Flavobacterium sp.]|uniref:putative porin n=1 Tax=Flavobacterium sp. TaxID=239 RepID=UPI004048CB13